MKPPKERCEVCGISDPVVLRLHHKVPICRGGTNEPSNLAVLCCNCHAKVHASSADLPVGQLTYKKYKLSHKWSGRIKKLSIEQKLALYSLFLQDELFEGDFYVVYNTYKKVCAQARLSPLSKRDFFHRIVELRNLGLVKIGGGLRRGERVQVFVSHNIETGDSVEPAVVLLDDDLNQLMKTRGSDRSGVTDTAKLSHVGEGYA